MPVRFDNSHAPLFIITFDGIVSDEEFDGYLRRMAADLKANDVILTVIDARKAGKSSVSHMQKQAAWMKEHRDLIRRSLGTVFVIDNAMVRFALSTVFTIAPLPGTYTVTTTLREAVSWAEQRFATSRVPMPVTARGLRE